MSVYVVDASVGVKWLVPEVHTAAAERLRLPGNELHVPGFFYLEVGNVLWKKFRRGEITADEARRCLSILASSPVVRHPEVGLFAAAYDIAAETGRTVYDSAYLALASQLGGQAVTADEKLRNALRGTAWERFLCWIEDVP